MNSLASMDRGNYRSFPYSQSASTATFRFRLSLALLAVDIAAVSLSYAIVSLAAFGALWPAGQPFLLGAFLPIHLICGKLVSAYSGPSVLRRLDTVLRGGGAFVIAVTVMGAVIAFLRVEAIFPHRLLFLGIGMAGLLLMLARYLCLTRSARVKNGSLYSILELRDGVIPDHPGEAPSLDTSVFLDPANPTPESLDMLATLIGDVDRVIVKCPSGRRRAWIHIMQGMNVHCEIVIPSIGDARLLGIGSYVGRTTLVVARGPLTLRERLIKRIFDIVFSLSALTVLSPMLVLVALLIKLDSPGPVMFKQSRIGRQNKLFHVHKFRSMYTDQCDPAGARSTDRNDARITRVGRVIRRLSIDELPQLLDVLSGKMSIVGPRPHAISSTAEDRLFWEIDNRYWHRHACKPGLTGLAQVRGYRGSTTRISDLTDRLASDMEYLAQWSFWRDLGIILQTVKVLFHRNAF